MSDQEWIVLYIKNETQCQKIIWQDTWYTHRMKDKIDKLQAFFFRMERKLMNRNQDLKATTNRGYIEKKHRA